MSFMQGSGLSFQHKQTNLVTNYVFPDFPMIFQLKVPCGQDLNHKLHENNLKVCLTLTSLGKKLHHFGAFAKKQFNEEG